MQDLAAATRIAAHLEECTGDEDPSPPLVPAVKEKIIAYLMPAGLGLVNAFFQQNLDPFATFCGSMKILGLEKITAVQSQD
jgi:hypothetical protein